MNEINKIKELGLPIVTPTRDLALPNPVIDEVINQMCMPFNWDMAWMASMMPMANQPIPFSDQPGQVPDVSQINTYDARAATYMHDFENSLNNLNMGLGLLNQNGGTYWPAEANEVDYHQTSEVNTDAYTPARKMSTFMKGHDNISQGEGVPLLEKLKGHPCKTEHVYNPSTKRMNKIITCLYPNCGKKFNKTWNILDHFKVHTGDKPYKWKNCKKTFSQKGNLTKHLKLHSKCSKADM